jgi:hypothetical protein
MGLGSIRASYGDDVAPLIDRSAKLLSGGNADAAAERELLTELLELACLQPRTRMGGADPDRQADHVRYPDARKDHGFNA